MFGEKLDYLILRPLAHKRHLATEEELDERSRRPVGSFDAAVPKLKKHIDYFEGKIPISDKLYYLDVGCGQGELAILLAKMGAGHITGIDFVPRFITTGEIFADQASVSGSVEFKCENIHDWKPPRKFDVLLSFDVFEHIEEPKLFLSKMGEFIAPDGVAILSFGPLFHSPFGDHMRAFFRMQIPWRGVLFSEKAILRVRREYYRPTDSAERFQEIVGGLNLMRYSDFRKYVSETGWEFSFLAINPSLKRWPALHFVSNVIAKIPILGDYFVYSVYAILRRTA